MSVTFAVQFNLYIGGKTIRGYNVSKVNNFRRSIMEVIGAKITKVSLGYELWSEDFKNVVKDAVIVFTL